MRAGPFFIGSYVLALALAAGACDDPTGFGAEPEILEDTVLVAAPTAQNADLPTALDLTPEAHPDDLGRFPERLAHAEQWDLAVRVRNGELSLVPPAVLGLTSQAQQRAAVAEPVTGRTFEQVDEAPASSQFKNDRVVPLRRDVVYVVRTRVSSRSGCTYFAKVQALEVDAARGTARVRVATSGFCGDVRLTPED